MPKCCKCCVEMVDSKALAIYLCVSPDWLGQRAELICVHGNTVVASNHDPKEYRGRTMYQVPGPATLQDCFKCPECGYSITKGRYQ